MSSIWTDFSNSSITQFFTHEYFYLKIICCECYVMWQACTDCCKRECETWQSSIEWFQGEDKLCLTNESELLADNIGLAKMSKTENDISEFDEFMEDYLTSQELLNIELHAPSCQESQKKLQVLKRKRFSLPIYLTACSVSINYYNR